MKKLTFLVLLIVSFLICSTVNVFAIDVTSLTFSITSSATTSTPNLRITAQKSSLLVDKKGGVVQDFLLESGVTFNYYLTKSTTFPVTSEYLRLLIEVDQSTQMKVNSDTTHKILTTGNRVFSVK